MKIHEDISQYTHTHTQWISLKILDNSEVLNSAMISNNNNVNQWGDTVESFWLQTNENGEKKN